MDFAKQIRPILESQCQPCHFSGGIMYERRPFDRPETIHALGEQLFTRISNREELADAPFDRRAAALALKMYLGA